MASIFLPTSCILLIFTLIATIPVTSSFTWQPSLIRLSNTIQAPLSYIPTISKTQSPSPDVLLLSPTSSITRALEILGYTYIPYSSFNSTSYQPEELVQVRDTHKSFTTVPYSNSLITVNTLLATFPNTKIIQDAAAAGLFPTSETCGHSWLGREIGCRRNYQSSLPSSTKKNPYQASQQTQAQDKRILRFTSGGKESVRGDRWMELCGFLGEGYSVIERLGLREFPAEKMERSISWSSVFMEKMGMGSAL